MLKVSNVTIEKGGSTILQDVEFQIAKGEIIALFGPSGCGKSSLVRACAGLDDVQEGSISLDGADVRDVLRTGSIGYVAQHPILLPWFDAEQNAVLISRCRDGTFNSDEFRDLIELVELDSDQLKRKPRKLAGGQQQRVVLVRALLPRPRLLLLDEAFSSLDAGLKWRLVPRLRSLLRMSQHLHGTVMVSHDVADCLLLADRIVIHSPAKRTFQGGHTVALPAERSGMHVKNPDFQREFLAVFEKASV